MPLSGDPTQFLINAIYLIPALLIGLIGHAFAHALVAVARGDQTPRIDGRLSLNPSRHLDPLGTIAIFLIGFGWAKPVRINPYRMHSRFDPALVGLAGPVANLLLAIVLAIPIKLAVRAGTFNDGSPPWHFSWPPWHLLYLAFILNVVLAIFNLLPLPPLDGYNVLAALFRRRFGELFFRIDMNRQVIILLFVLVLVVASYVGTQVLQVIAQPVADVILKAPPFPLGR